MKNIIHQAMKDFFKRFHTNHFPGVKIKYKSVPINYNGIASISVPLRPEKPFVKNSCPECGIVDGHWHECSKRNPLI